MADSRVGRFEQSFMFHMIRDFFLLLLLVAGIELAIRYIALRWDFARAEPQRVDQAAEKLANDVRSIMLNSGGPLAAQTVYPILNRAYDELGLSIAVEPAAVTIESMKVTRNMDPKGLPAVWPSGAHNAASVAMRAEQFCLGCHVKAQVGDVLGTVTVRSYLARKEAVWWQEVRLTIGALSLKILAHTIVLFLLLKVRMEPLLTLRATVAGLAKGVMDLSPRARVKSEDEFGELALDLNHFLDRIALVVHDLDKVLGEVVSVGGRLGTLNRQLEQQLDGLRDDALDRLGQRAEVSVRTQVLGARESGAFHVLAQLLEDMAERGAAEPAARQALREQLARLRQSFDAVQQALHATAAPLAVPHGQSAQYQAFAQSLREMAMLEATMQSVAEAGRELLQRLTEGRAAALRG